MLRTRSQPYDARWRKARDSPLPHFSDKSNPCIKGTAETKVKKAKRQKPGTKDADPKRCGWRARQGSRLMEEAGKISVALRELISPRKNLAVRSRSVGFHGRKSNSERAIFALVMLVMLLDNPPGFSAAGQRSQRDRADQTENTKHDQQNFHTASDMQAKKVAKPDNAQHLKDHSSGEHELSDPACQHFVHEFWIHHEHESK